MDVRTVRRHLHYLESEGYLTVQRSGPTARSRYVVAANRFGADTNPPSNAAGWGNRVRSAESLYVASPGSIVPSNILHNYEKTSANTGKDQRPQASESAQMLMSFGVNEPTRSELASRYSMDQIGLQISWMAYRRVRDPNAALVTALREGWAEPSAAREARNRAEQDELQERLAVEAEALVENVSVAPHARTQSRQLPAEARYAFWDRARDALGGRVGAARYGRERFDSMVAKYALHLIGEASTVHDEAS